MLSAPRTLLSSATQAFQAHFGDAPRALGWAPGRVELLGNHTDYNGGLVLAAAIDRSTIVLGRPRPDRTGRFLAVNLDETDEFALDAIERPHQPGSWARYTRGVCWALAEAHGPLSSGFEAVVLGDVPLGAGLSSSASLQVAIAQFLIGANLVSGMAPFQTRPNADVDHASDDVRRMELAQTLRRSENEFVGVGSGLLDQFSSLFGRADHGVLLDCRSLAHERLSLDAPAPSIVICDSQTSRRLADGMYDRRRAECERVVSALRGRVSHQGEFQLSMVPLELLESEWGALDPLGRKRARHVLSENERVRQGAAALKSGDVAAFGRLMSASHASSRDDFENSSSALDALIDAAEQAPGFLGGKLSGAGWAGCTVNLVLADRADDFVETVTAGYARRTGVVPRAYVCRAADGAFSAELGPVDQ